MRRPSPASVPPLPSWAKPEKCEQSAVPMGAALFCGGAEGFCRVRAAGWGEFDGSGGRFVRGRCGEIGIRERAGRRPPRRSRGTQASPASAARRRRRACGPMPGLSAGLPRRERLPLPRPAFLPVCGLTPALQTGPPGGCAKGAEIGAQPPAAEPPLRPKAAETARRAVWAAPLPPPPSRHSPFCKIRL